ALRWPRVGCVVYIVVYPECGLIRKGEQRHQGHRRARRVLRERPQALQKTMRESRALVGVQEASALREAQRSAEAESPRRPQEGQAARTDVRVAAALRVARRHSRDPGGERMSRRVEAGRTWEPGTEWNAVRALLAHEAVTEMGRERATTAEPLTDPAGVLAAIDLTRQARVALSTVGSLPLEGFADIRPVLTRCRADGSVLDGLELVQIIPALDASPKLHAYGKAVRETSPDVSAITDALPRVNELADQLRRALDADGGVADDASPTLKRLRREIRERRRRLSVELERAFQGSEADRLFTDRYVTLRHGRYVLPVRAEARGRVSGIVHDRSQSGQTLFVEPAEIVEANNDLVQAVREEEHETARILAELTGAVRGRADDLARLVEAIGELDWIFARAAAADRMGATPPALDAGHTVALKNARHPLLLAQHWRDPSRPVVPVDIELSAERPLLVLTGPNAGGKTIALKTAALLALMAQVGCHVPADEGSRLP